MMLLSLRTHPDTSVVAILDLSHDGKQLLSAVEIDGFGTLNGDNIDSNAITTIHKRVNAQNLLLQAIQNEANNNTSIFYIEKEKARRFLAASGVQFPRPTSISNGFNHIIRESGSPVNNKLENVTYSQQFKRWFGDWVKHLDKASKVVNADGTPKIVYHGTDAEFTVFEKEKIGSNTDDGIYGRGFYFSSNYKQSAQYGNVGSYYLNIKKPLVLSSRTDIAELAEELNMREGNFTKTSDGFIKPVYSQVQQFASHVKEAGYDGIIVDYGTSDEIIVFEPTQIKSATDNIGSFDGSNPDIRYSIRDDVDEMGFYSQMGRVIEGYKGDKIAGNSLVSYLKGHGVKDDEIKWSGIAQFVEGKKSVSKAELMEYVRNNTLEIKESNYTDYKQSTEYGDFNDWVEDTIEWHYNDDNDEICIQIGEDEYRTLSRNEDGEWFDDDSGDQVAEDDDAVEEYADYEIEKAKVIQSPLLLKNF